MGRFVGGLALILLLQLLARLPLLREPANVTPDGAEYLAIARSLLETGRYATDLKWQFYTPDPVEHPAWSDRPPLYPVVAAACGRLFPFLDLVTAARLGNLLLAVAACALAALWLRRLFGERVALFAAGYVFLLPHTLFWTTQPLTEALALLLAFAAFALWSRLAEAGKPDDLPGMAAVGALVGLGYLTRPTGALLLPALAIGTVWAPGAEVRPGRAARRIAAAAALAAGFLVVALPYHAQLYALYGSPFRSALGFTFSVATVHDVTVFGFEREIPPPARFLREHAAEVPGWVAAQAAAHAQALLLPLAALLPLAGWMRRRHWSGLRLPTGLWVLFTLLLHTAAWSARGSSRYFLGVLPLLAAALLGVAWSRRDGAPETAAPARALRPPAWLAPAGVALSLFGLAAALVPFYAAQSRPDGGVPSLLVWKAAAPQVRGARLVASDHPWIVNLLAGVPAVMLPRTTDPVRLERFLRAYRPDALLLFPDEPGETPMAAAWRAGQLPRGWRLVPGPTAGPVGYLLARPAPGGPGGRLAGPPDG